MGQAASFFPCSLAKRAGPYLGLDHVDPPRAQLSDAVVDVHHALPLGHVQHDVDDDEAAGASRPSAAGE